MKNYYEILEVHKKASHEVIDRAYKALVMKYHPDRGIGDSELANEKMLELNEAYSVLSNDVLRERYNREYEEYEFQKIMEKRNRQFNEAPKNDNTYSPKMEQHQEEKHQVGTLGSMFGIVNSILKKRKQGNKKLVERMDQQTILAILITILIVIVVCIVLWFIPFTNNFVRSITVDNPLLSWMFKG